jgi:ABC-type multidrug transport system fused ATPase/permease subunit
MQIGIVTQDTVLFDDTIARNIAYGAPQATRERSKTPRAPAHAHEFIQTLPDKYDTGSANAASGCRAASVMRLAIARRC